MCKFFVVIKVVGGIVKIIHCPDDVDIAIIDQDNETVKNNRQICCECGESIAFGSGNFVNRIPNLNDYNIRLEMGAPYPKGAFVCDDCDNLR